MPGMLRPGQEMSVEGAAARCRIRNLLGGGSQGEVYEADLEGAAVALKWYFPSWATVGQRRALEGLVERRSPRPALLWPPPPAPAPRGDSHRSPAPLPPAPL